MVPISKMRLPNRQGLCAGNSLLEELERSLLGLGDLGLDVVRLDVRTLSLGLDVELAELSDEALDLLGLLGVDLLLELVEGLLRLGGDRVGRVGSLDEVAAGPVRAPCCRGAIIDSISLSERPDEAAMVIDWSLLVALSLAETLTIPSASMSNVTSIWGIPLGAGGIPTSWKLPSILLSRTSSRSPWNTLISTAVWPSAAVEKVCDFLVGMVVLRLIRRGKTPPRVYQGNADVSQHEQRMNDNQKGNVPRYRARAG